ncbi:MAG: histidine phosphatase family protein [Spirochaetia bacterium]|jgi:broad specificity phosphatase PhoE|nr:histidine phosphatase family protein [Spirochaetia bacterium]
MKAPLKVPLESALAVDAAFFSDLTDNTSFYIMRHGESLANAGRRMQGRQDFRLNESGRDQASVAGQWFKDKKVARVLCSPLARASETAAIVASVAGFPEPEIEPTLIELDIGKFSGLTLEEAKDRFPEEHQRFTYLSWEGVSDAETVDQLVERATAAWVRLKAAAVESGGNVLALTHGGTIQWLVRLTFGCRSWMPLLTTGNCGIFELVVKPTLPGKPAYLHWKEINLIPGDPSLLIPPVF